MARSKIVWSSLAETELMEVLEYWVERNNSADFSKKIVRLIKQREKLLLDYPFLGKPTNIENVRGVLIIYYLLIYKITNDRIEVLSFFDARQDPDKLKKNIQ
jgi:toxin YoeB